MSTLHAVVGSGTAALAVYSRLTLITDDAAAASAMSERSTLPDVVQSYDLLAVQPLTERVFQLVRACSRIPKAQGSSVDSLCCNSHCGLQACSTLAVDIITVDVARRLPFRVKPATLQVAVKRGIHFEVRLSRHYSDLEQMSASAV
jgi:ribonuclease P/MRP protein subunit RPP1